MKIFITGVTGYIGQKLALQLAADGHTIHALVRNEKKGKALLHHHKIVLFQGDILDPVSLLNAMAGCDQVYHLAALASVWHEIPQSFQVINVKGLQNVLDACLKLDIKDVLFTSTAGVVGDSEDGKPVCELTNPNPKLETLYEQSKVDAEQLLKAYIPKGIRGIIVNPSRVYGPGLLTESNGFTRLMKMYISGHWKIKPCNGKSIGNYVYIDDTIKGLIAAMEKAKPGERYLLGGVNATYNEFFSLVDELTGVKRKMYNVPLPVMLFLSRIQLLMARLFGKQPMITPPFVRKYNKHWVVSSNKAEQEIGYTIIPLREGVSKTLNWLNQSV
ncbi:NAD-dependent epimerase/dehydratase family protein [Mucilaginibacter sp. RB4R14]|uniref:NAD-dependent epimerase/dehydratase family protein n=1 Tax=Mucilaginibacter aurantiaciroseus TaxID=2949308 RepID=UPI002091C9E9|nr:NAD-dependent epimerase/dehydratase family protein [Mucilaginibacter aurantiaciroseus]MCO5936662.1 NAD-dependent epimerase/dehydratase family protein [Mucilaginibacter aurantiaciroseus]